LAAEIGREGADDVFVSDAHESDAEAGAAEHARGAAVFEEEKEQAEEWQDHQNGSDDDRDNAGAKGAHELDGSEDDGDLKGKPRQQQQNQGQIGVSDQAGHLRGDEVEHDAANAGQHQPEDAPLADGDASEIDAVSDVRRRE